MDSQDVSIKLEYRELNFYHLVEIYANSSDEYIRDFDGGLTLKCLDEIYYKGFYQFCYE